MQLAENHKYQVKIELTNLLSKEEFLRCEPFLTDLNLPGFATCKFLGKFLEIIFYPPKQIDDEFVLRIIHSTLKQIKLEYTRAVLRQYVGSALKTLTGSAVGGALGSRAGPIGAVVGIILGAVVEKALFDWKDLCDCCPDQYGNYSIHRLGDQGV